MIDPNHLRILAQIIDSMDDIIKKIETAKNMQKKGYKTEEIAEIIELPIIEIKKALDIH